MSEPKKYYWLKLKKDFFRQKEIKKLRSIAGGDTFTIIYLKLLLLSIEHDGVLVYEGVEKTLQDELALEIDEEIENVTLTLNFLFSHGLISEYGDDQYLLSEAKTCTGKESDSRVRVQEHRSRIKAKAKNIPLIERHSNVKNYGGNYYVVLGRDRHQCVICGSGENIIIHHIIGNRDEEQASKDASSLITLCKSCHSREHNDPGLVVTDFVLRSIGFNFSLKEKIKEINSNSSGSRGLILTYDEKNDEKKLQKVTSNTEKEKEKEKEKRIPAKRRAGSETTEEFRAILKWFYDHNPEYSRIHNGTHASCIKQIEKKGPASLVMSLLEKFIRMKEELAAMSYWRTIAVTPRGFLAAFDSIIQYESRTAESQEERTKRILEETR